MGYGVNFKMPWSEIKVVEFGVKISGLECLIRVGCTRYCMYRSMLRMGSSW